MAKAVQKTVALAALVSLAFGALPSASARPRLLRIDRVDVSAPPLLRLYVTSLDTEGKVAGGGEAPGLRLLVDGLPHKGPPKTVQRLIDRREPVAAVVLLQVSAAMARAFDPMIKGATDLIDGLPKGSKVGVMGYADVVVAEHPPTSIPQARQQLKKLALRDRAEVFLPQAIRRAVQALERLEQPRAKLLILVSDGLTTDVKPVSFKKLGRDARRRGIAIYAIGIKPPPLAPATGGLRGLQQLSSYGGGTARRTSVAALGAALRSLKAELRQQAVLTFELGRVFDGKRHDLEVTLGKLGSGPVEIAPPRWEGLDAGKRWYTVPWLLTVVIAGLLLVITGVVMWVWRSRARRNLIIERTTTSAWEDDWEDEEGAVQDEEEQQWVPPQGAAQEAPVDAGPAMDRLFGGAAPPPAVSPSSPVAAPPVAASPVASPIPSSPVAAPPVAASPVAAPIPSSPVAAAPASVVPAAPEKKGRPPVPTPMVPIVSIEPSTSSPGAGGGAGWRKEVPPDGGPARSLRPAGNGIPGTGAMPVLPSPSQFMRQVGGELVVEQPGGGAKPLGTVTGQRDPLLPPAEGLDRRTQVMQVGDATTHVVAWIMRLGGEHHETHLLRDGLTIGMDVEVEPARGRPGHAAFYLDPQQGWVMTVEGGASFAMNDNERFAVGADEFVFKMVDCFGEGDADPREVAWLQVIGGIDDGRRVPLVSERLYSLGTEPTCNVMLRGAGVGPRHLLARVEGSQCQVIDLGCEAGLRFDDRPVGSALLCSNDRVEVGGISLMFRVRR